MKSFFKLIKVNYRNNYIGYIIIGILLLIPITYCAIQTYNLYDAGYSIEDVEHLKNQGIDEFFWDKLNDIAKTPPFYIGWTRDGSVILFSLLNIVVMITIFILSRRNRLIRKFKVVPFTILSLIVYGIVLSLIEIWFDCVTATIFQGWGINTPHFTSIYSLSSKVSFWVILDIVVLCVLWKAINILRTIKRKWVIAVLILIYAILFPFVLESLLVISIFFVGIRIIG